MSSQAAAPAAAAAAAPAEYDGFSLAYHESKLLPFRTLERQTFLAAVGDVRGKGLMIGVEIVRDQRTKERAKDLRDKVVLNAFHKGLLTLDSGENSIRISPPLIIDEEQADCAIQILEQSLQETEKAL